VAYVAYLIYGLFAASVGYILVACYCVLAFKRRLTSAVERNEKGPVVTLYKPLYGMDYELKQNLLSFCDQDYPVFQIIFGISDNNDPAIPVVRDVMAERPDVDMELVINERSNGNNPKVSNLMNMDSVAKYDLLIMSDSDMRVEPDYIDRIVSGFSRENVGLVTCLYKGTPAPGFASKLGAMFINQWFSPSSLIPATFGGTQHCFGATMAIKRGTLNSIGGFEALVSNLADDYTLGRLVREAGFEVHLGSLAVENIVDEAGLKSLISHELRWARTIRSVEPLGFLSTFLTDVIPLGFIAGLYAYFAGLEPILMYGPIITAFFARSLLHFSTKATFISKHPDRLWVVPLRDVLSFFIRILCYTGRTVKWRSSELSVGKHGEID
jgi:ceramide glucosyltransferase